MNHYTACDKLAEYHMEEVFSTPAFKKVIRCYSRDNRAPDAKSCLEKYLKSQNTTEVGQQDAHNELNDSYAILQDKLAQMENKT